MSEHATRRVVVRVGLDAGGNMAALLLSFDQSGLVHGELIPRLRDTLDSIECVFPDVRKMIAAAVWPSDGEEAYAQSQLK